MSREKNKTKDVVAIIIVVVIAGLGTYLYTRSHAASLFASVQTENGVLAGQANIQSDSSASDGSAVRFGSSGSGLPTPSTLDALYKTDAFNEPFSGTALSTATWETCIWYDPCNKAGDISDANGGTADASDVTVNTGLTLSATSANPPNAQSWGNGWIDSAPYYETPNGSYYVEIKAKLPPAAPGLWPALVLYADTLKQPTDNYAEMDILERVSQPQSNGTVNPPTAFQSWHPAVGTSVSNQIGTAGIDLTGWNTYGVSVSSAGSIQYWFNNTAVGSPIAGGSNALEGMFINLAMTTGGTPNDGWAGVPSSATLSPSLMNIAYVRVFTP